MLADMTPVQSNRCADVIIPFKNANIRLRDAFLVPSLGYNLVSTGRLADNGIESKFRRNDVLLTLESDGFRIGTGQRDQETRLYTMPEPVVDMSSERAMVGMESTTMLKQRFGTDFWHISTLVTS